MRFSGGIDAASSNRKRRMRKQSLRTIIAGGAAGSLVLTLLGPLGGAAAFPVVDGNEDDIGLYTDGSSDSMDRSEEHTSELQSRGHLVCRLLLEKKK